MSAVDQYIEAVPTSTGPKPTGPSTGAGQPLPPPIVSQVRAQAGGDAEKLIEVATSPTHGAPSRPRIAERVVPREVRDPMRPEPSPLDAVVSPLAEGGDSRFVVLLVLLVGMTLTALTLAARQQRP